MKYNKIVSSYDEYLKHFESYKSIDFRSLFSGLEDKGIKFYAYQESRLIDIKNIYGGDYIRANDLNDLNPNNQTIINCLTLKFKSEKNFVFTDEDIEEMMQINDYLKASFGLEFQFIYNTSLYIYYFNIATFHQRQTFKNFEIIYKI